MASSYGERPTCAWQSPTRQYEDHRMKVAQAISRALVSEGVTLAAGIAGQSIWPIIDAIGDCEEVSLMYARQERVAFDICDGFARASGNPAVVFTDAGPAAANLMGGIVNSWGDSVPVLFIAGHNDRTKSRQQVHQGAPVPRDLQSGQQVVGHDRRSVEGGGDAAARLHAYADRTSGPGRARRAARRRADGGRQFRISCRCRRARACAAAPIPRRSARPSI